jgi:hypothetical protein
MSVLQSNRMFCSPEYCNIVGNIAILIARLLWASCNRHDQIASWNFTLIRTSQCDQTFSAVITKRGAEILPNWIFFYQTRANSAFLKFLAACSHCSHVLHPFWPFSWRQHNETSKPSNNHVNIISNTFLDMKASNINYIQGLKFIFFLGIQQGYQDSKFSIPLRIQYPTSGYWLPVP